jgi:hypothetical protein
VVEAGGGTVRALLAHEEWWGREGPRPCTEEVLLLLLRLSLYAQRKTTRAVFFMSGGVNAAHFGY